MNKDGSIQRSNIRTYELAWKSAKKLFGVPHTYYS